MFVDSIRRGRVVPHIVVATASCLLSLWSWEVAGDVYFYESAAGRHLVTDHPVQEAGMVLRRRISLAALGDDSSRWTNGSTTRGAARAATTSPSGSYDRLIRRIARQYGIEPSLVKAIMHAESWFNPRAVSRAGAQGLMQLMPATAKQYGVRDAFNPEQNLQGALRYLKFLNDLFPNQPEWVIAAYNAGENAVFRYQGIPPYAETQKYVKKVVALKRFYDLVQSP